MDRPEGEAMDQGTKERLMTDVNAVLVDAEELLTIVLANMESKVAGNF